MDLRHAFRYAWLIVISASLLVSCKKNDDDDPPVDQKPKVGTTWTFSYYVYNQQGGVTSSKTINWKAVAEVTINGEKWLRVNEMGVDTTVYLLREKSDGLYHYDNNQSYLLCKNPAAANETYTTNHHDTTMLFNVVNANFTLPTNLGDIKANYYQGFKNALITDDIWFNSNAWIVRMQYYRKPPLGVNYKYSAHFIQAIVY